MRKLKKLAALSLAAVMTLSMAACGKDDDKKDDDKTTEATNDTTENTTQGGGNTENNLDGGGRTIKIGTWWDMYYGSNDADIYADPSVSDEELAQKHFDALKRVEEKYNVKIEYVNLTYDGIQESINNSILAGKPDCDIYLVNSAIGVPAVANGYVQNLEDVLPADCDLFTDQNYLKPVNLPFEGTYLMGVVGGEDVPAGAYCLAFNKQMLEDAGLENPNDLYERGEWTWDKWREYLIALTKDSDGDGVTDVYGYGARYDFLINGLTMSNGTQIASTDKENLSSKEVGEVLDFIYKMYNVDHVAKPWNVDDFNANHLAYQDGSVACWITAAWIADGDDDVGFDQIWCPFPIGPSGNQETNPRKNAGDLNYYMIPVGVDNPYLVYSAFSDYQNWYEDDFELRDWVNEWWHDNALTEENYNVMYYVGEAVTLDFWNTSSELNAAVPQLLDGTMTAAQFQESYKNTVQSFLDDLFK